MNPCRAGSLESHSGLGTGGAQLSHSVGAGSPRALSHHGGAGSLPPAGLPRAWAPLVRCHRGSPRCSPSRWGGPQHPSSRGGPLGGEARRCLEEANSGRLQILQRQEGEGQLTSSVRDGRKSRPGVREALWLITSQKKWLRRALWVPRENRLLVRGTRRWVLSSSSALL